MKLWICVDVCWCVCLGFRVGFFSGTICVNARFKGISTDKRMAMRCGCTLHERQFQWNWTCWMDWTRQANQKKEAWRHGLFGQRTLFCIAIATISCFFVVFVERCRKMNRSVRFRLVFVVSHNARADVCVGVLVRLRTTRLRSARRNTELQFEKLKITLERFSFRKFKF